MSYYRTVCLWLIFPALCVLGPAHGEAQSLAAGIYFVFTEGRCLDNKVRKVNAPGSICIPDNPLFTLDDFVQVDRPKDDFKNGNRMLSIELSEESSVQLAAITEMYTGKQLALILDNKAVFILEIERKITSGNIILREPLGGSMLEATYQTLIKVTAG